MFRQSITTLRRNLRFNTNRRFLCATPPNALFGKYLLLTNSASCGVTLFLGDLIQQEIEYQRNVLPERYDYARLTRMSLVGLSFGPLHHFYYKYINIMFPKRDFKHITYKLIADQVIMSPICIAQFFFLCNYLEGKSLDKSIKEFQNKFVNVYTVDCTVWPPVQFINFYFVPVRFQVIYINMATMLYNVFLSYVKHVDEF